MLFTIDRLQFIGDKLVCFEFIDLENIFLENNSLKRYLEEKISHLEQMEFIDDFYLLQYTSSDVYIGRKTNSIHYTMEEFKLWFDQINNNSKALNSSSKRLGSATENIGDPYVQDLLNNLFSSYSKPNEITLNLNGDDNGLKLVKKCLDGKATFGFDFDLYDSINHSIIEFLKRDSHLVNNLTAHPARYSKNKKKFASLWKAANKINPHSPCLYLVNYSDDYSEAISIIEVIDFDLDLSTPIMIKKDIGYKIKNRKELYKWLMLMNHNPKKAYTFLQSKPKEVRSYEFFKDVYFNNGKSKIGKNYI